MLGSLVSSRAASGTWTNDASSIWSAGTNWSGGVIADGIDSTADFSTIGITSNRTVTLDSSRSIGNLWFGNPATPGGTNWILNPSGGSILTLAVSSGSPTITVTNRVAINAALAGASGLTKAGSGVLALGGTNTYTGATTVSAGSLQITNGPGGLQTGSGGLVAYYSFNRVVGSRVINEGSGGALMDGYLVGNGGVNIAASSGRFGDNCLNVTQGAVHNGANVANIGNGGYLLVDNPVVPFSVTTAAANWSWAMWIKTTTAGAAYMYQGSGNWASGNTAFYLNNGATSGAKAGGVRWGQGWEAGTATINDGNWHHIAMTCNAGTRSLYVDGAVDALAANGWSGAGTGNQLWIGGSGGATGDGNVQMVGQIDKVAIYNRPLSQAEVQSLTNNVVPGLAAPAIPLNSQVSVASGAKLDVNGYYATVTNLTGSGMLDTTVSGGYLAANYGADATFNATVTNSVGTLNFYKLGPGKLTLAGSLGNNNTVIRQGTVQVTGSILTNGANNTVTVADGVDKAILSIPSGSTVIARNLVLGGISASAGGGGAAGAVYNNGVFKNFGNTGTGAFAIGNATGGAANANNGYGYFLHDSATALTLGETGIGGLGGGDGVFELKSGTANFTNWITLGRSQGTVAGSAQRSLFLIRNGTVFGPSRQTTGDGIRFNWSGSTISQISVVDIGAGGKLGSLTAAGVFGANINLNQANNSGAAAILTVSGGGAVEVYNIYSYNASPLSIINLNNATLSPAGSYASFLGTGLDDVFVYAGGVTFDTKGYDAGIIPQLIAPSGSGITAIPLTGNGSGYIGRPIVQITDGSGVGATAVAEWDANAGTVTSITITSPGSGYSAPTVTLVGGGFTTAATVGTPILGAATSGGLTKVGAGTLTLSGGYTYTGDTVVQAGGLYIPTSLVTPATAGSLWISNAALTLDLSGGTALPLNNLTLQNNVTNYFNYGSVSANPANPAINASGSLSAPGTGIVINIAAFGLKTGQFPLIKYTGTPLASLANFSFGTLPPGVTANLVNNTGNDSIDINITGTGQDLAWYGLLPDGVTVSSNWDITLTTNWVSVGTTSPALRYQEYTSAGSTVGDPVTFDDTLYLQQATNINLTTTVRPFRLLVDSTLPYSISSSAAITNGMAGLGGIVKSNTGSLTLLTSNSFSGGVSINGGAVVITNDFALGANSGVVTLNGGALQVNGATTNGARAFSVPATSSIGVVTNATARFGGNVTGAGSLTKLDDGTLVLAGSNGITGNLQARQGTLSTAGPNVLPAVVQVADTAGLNGILNVSGGAFQANNNGGQYASSLTVGSVSGAAGELAVSGGALTVAQQLGLGTGTGGYAGLTLSSGSLVTGSYIVVGFNTDTAVYTQSGGTATVTSNQMTIAAGGTASVGQANILGGTLTSAGVGGGIMVGERGVGTMNVSGTGSVVVTNNGLTLGPVATQTGWSGTLNLLGGTLTANRVAKGLGTGTARVNFNGGALKPNVASGTFLTGLDSATVYNGGLTIDDSVGVTVAQPLQLATGLGVTSIALATRGSGYIDAPIVTISGGTGSNAMAMAQVNPANGTVTNLLITCPGSGYTSGDTLSLSFAGGGVAAVAPTAGAATFANNGTGGLTKKGSAITTLTGSNVFGGNIAVNAGTLAMTTASQVLGATTVSNGAVFSLIQVTTNTGTIGNLTLGVATTGAGASLGLALASGNSAKPFLTCGTLTLNASNVVALSGRFTVGAFPIIKYSGALAGTGSLTNATFSQGVSGYISNNAASSTIYAVVTSTGPGLVWTGTNSNPLLANLWDLNSTTNWLLLTTPTTYQETVPPGDVVTFNDIGSGTVNLNTKASPFSMLVSNNTVNYTFQGAGSIGGGTGLQKLGSRSLFMNLTNSSYTGDNVIGGGLVQMGSATALSSGANLTVASGATLELNGFSLTSGNLSGSGVIDNNSGNNVVLTVGSGGGSTWAGTIQDQGVGGVSLTKVGNNTLIISGTNSLNNTAASAVNAGTTIMTNNAVISLATSEFWVGAVGGGSATNIVDGATLTVANNWLVVGRGSASATGTMIVNHGTVQKNGANNIVVGSLGATGTLIVNGGQVLNNGMLWLGEGSTANASLYLNGGLIQASQVRPNNNGGDPVTSTAYFNGGTLQATAGTNDFIASPTVAYVQSGGLVLDDGGFSIGLTTVALQEDGASPGGGLVKKGAGTLYLDGINSYSGSTLVSNGTLAGAGAVNSPVLVTAGGNLGAGDAGTTLGTFTINNTLTLQGNTTLRINKTGGSPTSDLLAGISTVQYGGTLTISNQSSDTLVAGDSFTLFSAGAHSGSFSRIIGSPGAGMSYAFDPNSGVLSVVNGGGLATNPTNITARVSGSTLTLSWPGDHQGWLLQAQTNAIGVGLGTNWHDVVGSDAGTNAIVTMEPTNGAVFYRLRYP